MLGERSPQEVERLVLSSFVAILEVKSADEESLETHISVEASISSGMTEAIQQPGSSGNYSKFFLEEGVAHHHVVDDIGVVGASLVVGTPATVEELESTLLNVLLETILDLSGLASVPHVEILHLDVSELGPGALLHFGHDTVENDGDGGMLRLLVESSVVLIDGLEPAQVVVGVGDHVHEHLLVLILSVLLNQGFASLLRFFLLLLLPLLVLVVTRSVLGAWAPS
mmetsp:Transcript_33580/g.51656  ORF Transcript_33580/g.51656 Transcript_33580/m.51656 type:complete len:226 (+) Transcript_33580:2775-3452(+)